MVVKKVRLNTPFSGKIENAFPSVAVKKILTLLFFAELAPAQRVRCFLFISRGIFND